MNDNERQVFKNLKALKSNYPTIYKYLLSIIISLTIMPILIWVTYFTGDSGFILIRTSLGVGDALTFYASILAFIGTVLLGALALLQNFKFKKENDIAQNRLERMNARILSLDDSREKQKLFEMYFCFMEEVQKIFDPQYVLGDFSIPRESVQIYFSLKQCKINAQSIRRRLLFLDSSNASNDFLEYALNMIDEATEIVQLLDNSEESKKDISQLFKFMKENSKTFNDKSLIFIYEIHKSIFKEEFSND